MRVSDKKKNDNKNLKEITQDDLQLRPISVYLMMSGKLYQTLGDDGSLFNIFNSDTTLQQNELRITIANLV